MWFGPEGRPTFGWLHAPSGPACRAGVVICPPLGYDYMDAHYALRALAERLSRSGMCALRFDYDGTGDSAGDDRDPARVSSWLSSVSHAIELLRAAGVRSVSLVGMRVGAAIAAAAAARDGSIDQLVLWDPCSGKRFLKEQRALLSLVLSRSGTGSSAGDPAPFAIPGTCFSAETVSDLKQLTPAKLPLPLARRALVLADRDKPAEQCFLRAQFGHGQTVVEEALGHERLFGLAPPEQELPLASIAAVARWLGDGAPGHALPWALPQGRAQASLWAFGQTVTEEPVVVPPLGLFGMLALPDRPRGTALVIFLSAGNQHHVGPARLWVELSRRLAAGGFTSLRLDHSGLGDSPSRPGEDQWVCNKPSAFDDVAEAAKHLSPGRPSNVVLVGLCSGGYQALESALALGARGVVSINPGISFVPPERRAGLPPDPRRRVLLPKDEVPGLFRQGGRLGRLRERYPALAWTVRALAFSGNRPAKWLTDLARQGTAALIVCGDREVSRVTAGTSRARLRRLRRQGVVVDHWAGLEHQLLDVAQREAVLHVVADFVVENFAGPVGGQKAAL
jgi:alpha-beta hydrolase superfamily lysophospholipase